MDLSFGCVLLRYVTKRNPALSVSGPTWSIFDGLFWFLVGMMEVTDSESDSTGEVWSGKVSPGEYLV